MSIATNTDIANLALNMIGGGSIASIDDSSKQAVVCKRFIDLAVRQALTRGEFTGTIKSTELVLKDQWVRQDYQYSYFLPNDYIKGISISSLVKYEIEDGFLHTNAEPSSIQINYWTGTATNTKFVNPMLKYVYYPTNLGTLQPWVANYIAAQLADMISMELLNDINKVGLVTANLQKSYIFAKSHNLSEKNGKSTITPSWGETFLTTSELLNGN